MTLTPGITVVIPTIPPRSAMFARALDSVHEAARNLPAGVPAQLACEMDTERRGAAVTRHAGLMRVRTKWTAFLDDDDTMDPHHLLTLYEAAHEHEAQYLWSQFRIQFPNGRTQAGPTPLGAGSFEQWNDNAPAQTTITTLVRTELAQDVGGFLQPAKHDWESRGGEGLDFCTICDATDGENPCEVDGQRAGEDWLFTLACRAAGATFHHVPKVTWSWHHHASNTSGLPDRW